MSRIKVNCQIPIKKPDSQNFHLKPVRFITVKIKKTKTIIILAAEFES